MGYNSSQGSSIPDTVSRTGYHEDFTRTTYSGLGPSSRPVRLMDDSQLFDDQLDTIQPVKIYEKQRERAHKPSRADFNLRYEVVPKRSKYNSNVRY